MTVSEDAETWGFCASCERWFYCQGWDDTTVPAPACPVCSSEPVAFEAAAALQSCQDSGSSHGREQRTNRAGAGGWLRLEE